MKRLLIISILLIIASCKDSKTTGQGDIPKADVTARATEKELTISVSIPAGHHAYLNEGPDGAFIPVQVDWKAVVATGDLKSAPAQTKKPDGVKDDLSGAIVLRGMGDFVYTADFSKLKSVTVRTQICDDAKGICYRPNDQIVAIAK